MNEERDQRETLVEESNEPVSEEAGVVSDAAGPGEAPDTDNEQENTHVKQEKNSFASEKMNQKGEWTALWNSQAGQHQAGETVAQQKSRQRAAPSHTGGKCFSIDRESVRRRRKRRYKVHPIAPQLRTLQLIFIVLVVAALVCCAVLLGQGLRRDGKAGKQSDPGFSDRSDVGGGDDVWNYYETGNGERKEALPACSEARKGVTVPLNSAEGLEALSYQELYEKCLPVTVSIAVENREGSGSGSGIVLTEDGYIITCAHVVDDQSSAVVTTNDGKEFDAELVGIDLQTDLALLKINATGLMPAQFGQDTQLRVGDEAFAIGDPLGATFHGTLTNGIISAINRDVTLRGYSMSLIQTTAALNSGNSGGPLLNIYGQVVGINNMKMVSTSTTVEGLGFAIPTSTAKGILEALAKDGGISRPVLGISCYGVDAKAAEKLGQIPGLVVVKVDPRSDCAAQGIQTGDVVTAVDGTAYSDVTAMREYLGRFTIGQEIVLTVSRPKNLPKDDLNTEQSAKKRNSDEVTPVEYDDLGEISVKLVDQQTLNGTDGNP